MNKKPAVVGSMSEGKESIKRKRVNKRQWPLHNLQLNCAGNAAIFHIVDTCTKVSLFLCLLWLRKFICLFFCPFVLFCSFLVGLCVELRTSRFFKKLNTITNPVPSDSLQNYC